MDPKVRLGLGQELGNEARPKPERAREGQTEPDRARESLILTILI